MSTVHIVSSDFLQGLLNTFDDIKTELEQPEVVELTSLALDRKIADSIEQLQGELDE
jgi:hypothetical protein